MVAGGERVSLGKRKGGDVDDWGEGGLGFGKWEIG